MTEFQNEDAAAFRNFVHMDPAMFQEILTRVGPRIEKFDTWYHKAINPCLQTCHYTLLPGNQKEIPKPDVWLSCGQQQHFQECL